MSPKAVNWARSQNVANPNQRALLAALAGMSDDEGNVALGGPLEKLIGVVGDIDTLAKLNRATSSLIGAGLLSKTWHFDGYVYHWKLSVR